MSRDGKVDLRRVKFPEIGKLIEAREYNDCLRLKQMKCNLMILRISLSGILMLNQVDYASSFLVQTVLNIYF